VEGCPVKPLVTVLVMLTFQGTAPANMLTNGDARDGTFGWTTEDVFQGLAKTEVINGVPCFTLRSTAGNHEPLPIVSQRSAERIRSSQDWLRVTPAQSASLLARVPR
jgi:hypothetical protein